MNITKKTIKKHENLNTHSTYPTLYCELLVKFFFSIQLITSHLHLSAIKLLISEERRVARFSPEWVELKNKSGLYVFICNITGHIYVGSAKNLARRINEHFKGRRSNIPLQRSIAKYGLENFTLIILEYCEPKKLIVREQFYLEALNPNYNKLMNAGSSLGYKHTEEAIQKMSGINHPRYGKTIDIDIETRAKISSSLLGRQVVENTRKLISESLKAKYLSGYNNPFLGKTHSAETRSKISLALSGANHYNYGNIANNAFKVYVYTLENTLVKSYSSKTEAAQGLEISRRTVTNYIKSGKVFNGQYLIKDIPIN